jgi:molybdate-binding protein
MTGSAPGQGADLNLGLVHFADRSQGLIVATGNFLRIESLRDLARRTVRFANRQAGSGTRLSFDALLAAHRIRPAQNAVIGTRSSPMRRWRL